MLSDERIEIAERMRGPFDVCECVGHTYINGTVFGMQVCARDEQELTCWCWTGSRTEGDRDGRIYD